MTKTKPIGNYAFVGLVSGGHVPANHNFVVEFEILQISDDAAGEHPQRYSAGDVVWAKTEGCYKSSSSFYILDLSYVVAVQEKERE